MRSALTDKLKTQLSPRSGRQHDLLQAHEIALQRRLAVFQQHGDHLLEVGLQFIEGLALAVSARKARNVANEKARLRTALDHGRERTHSPIWFVFAHRRHSLCTG